MINIGDIKKTDHLLEREDFLVAARPAQPYQIIEHSSRQVPLLFILTDVDRAVAFRQLGSVGPQDHREMRIDRRVCAECLEHIDLSWRIVQVIITADNVAYLHVVIIDDDREIVGRRSIRSRNDKIIELRIFEHNFSTHPVLYDNLTMERIFESDDGIDARPGAGSLTTPTVVSHSRTGCHLLCAKLVDLFSCTVTAICVSGS